MLQMNTCGLKSVCLLEDRFGGPTSVGGSMDVNGVSFVESGTLGVKLA
jgi:hypothetical protein